MQLVILASVPNSNVTWIALTKREKDDHEGQSQITTQLWARTISLPGVRAVVKPINRITRHDFRIRVNDVHRTTKRYANDLFLPLATIIGSLFCFMLLFILSWHCVLGWWSVSLSSMYLSNPCRACWRTKESDGKESEKRGGEEIKIKRKW